MKKVKLRFFGFLAILITLVSLFVYVRMNSKKDIKENIYAQWTKHFVKADGNQAYVKTDTSDEEDIVLSEGQGYGMYIATLAAENGEANQDDFDKLYHYYLKHRISGTELMSWQQTIKDSQVEDKAHNATDGDLYIAYALIKAADLWPSKADEYKNQAQALLNDILTHNFNSELTILTVGNWAQVDSNYHNLMRTSDVLPIQFQAFYELTGNKQWLGIKVSMMSKLEQMSEENSTGLIPDFIWVSSTGDITKANPSDIATEYDGDYYYNACRLPYNLAQVDDKQSQKIVTKLLNFFMEQEGIYAGYNLSGEALNDYQAMSFSAPVFYAANKDTAYRKLAQQNKYIFLQDLSSENYYESAIITMVALESL